MTPTGVNKRVLILGMVLGILLLLPKAWIHAEENAAVENTVRSTATAGDAMIGGIRVVIDAPAERQAAYAAMADRLIGLQTGDAFTETAVQASIDALKLSHRFSAIHVDSVTTPHGEVLTYTLTPYQYLKKIRVRGNYPLFESEVLNQMTLYAGDPYTQTDLSDQVAAITKRYKREGYIDPRVSVQARQDPDDENAEILVDIAKGPHYMLGALTFEGNHAVSSGSLKWRMRVWRAALLPEIGRFSEYRLKQDVDRLLNYYRRKGFAEAELSSRTVLASDARHMDVTIQIQEGPRYAVAFEGNQRFWNLTLKKDVAIFTDGNRNNTGVRKSLKNIKKRYHEDGYLDVQVKTVAASDTGSPAGVRTLRFVIQEGPKTIVDTVAISGNQALSDQAIRKQMLSRPPTLLHDGAFVPETLEEDRYAITTLYMGQGFQNRVVDSEVTLSEDKTRADVAMKIDEGPQTRVRSIGINGLTEVPETAARAVLVHRIGEPFRQAALEAEKEAIASLVSEKGYPHVTVNTAVTFNDDQTQADIVHTVDPGPLVRLGDIYLSGNLRTAEKVIRRELGVEPGMPLSLRTLHDGQRRLRDLAIFHGVTYRTVGLKEKQDTVNLFVDIEENKPYYAQISTGYESDSGFFGRTKIGDHNLFGLNKDLWASGELSETGYRLETRLTEPRFLGTSVKASIGLFNEELTEFNQPFGTRTTGGSLGFGKEWGPHLTTALSFRLEKRDQFSVEDRPPGESDEATRTIFVTTPYLRYDSRDSFVRPTRGIVSSLSVDLSKGVQNQLDDFVRYQFDTRYYKTPLEGITFAGLARLGHVMPYGDIDQVPDDQLFFLGGIRDVRGYQENLLRVDENGNPVGGKTAIVGSLEARIDLGMNLELTTFYDIGSVQNAQVEGGSDRFRSSVGLGLRYITPIGPMGLLYGHKLDRDEGESAGRFHLSIGYSF